MKKTRKSAVKSEKVKVKSKVSRRKTASKSAIKSSPKKSSVKKNATTRSSRVVIQREIQSAVPRGSSTQHSLTKTWLPGALTESHGTELPFSYNKTKLALMIRDPYSIFCYWDFSSETWNWTQSILSSGCRTVLRVLEVTGVDYPNAKALSFYDIDVSLDARNWYVHVNKPDSEWIFELGMIDSNGEFHLIVRSNRVRTPRDMPSDVVDSEWMTLDFDELYALSGGFGYGLSSGEIRKMIKERYLLQKAIFSSFSNPTQPQKALSS